MLKAETIKRHIEEGRKTNSEQDLSNVGVSKVYALAEYFGVTIDEIKWEK